MYSHDQQETMSMDRTDGKHWFVLRVTYQRELIAKEKLASIGVRSFVPTLKEKRMGRNGVYEWKEKSALHNYIFIHSSKEAIDRIKNSSLPYLRYIILSDSDNKRRPMIVSDKQMEDFITVTRNSNEEIIYLRPDDISLTKGDKVRITEGPFKGVEGILVKVLNKKEKRVVVKIDGVTAVATAQVPSALIEKIA